MKVRFTKHLFLLIVFSVLCSVILAPCYAVNPGINFTEEELAFIREHPVIKLGVDPGFVPFEFIDTDGAYKGITADYLSLISERTGLQFKIEEGLTWPEAYDLALAGGVDGLPAVGKTAEREQHFLYSDPYYYFVRVIVTRDTDTSISGMEDLDGLTVAVQKNSSHHSYLLTYPGINLSLYDSVETALTAVATGEERAFVGNLATTNYLIRSNGLTNLRFIAFEAEEEQALYFAARKDWPELISIFNKALATVTKNEKMAISNKWVELDQEIDYGAIVQAVFIAGTLAAAILIVSFYWILRLKKEVITRKAIQADLELAKRQADQSNEFKSSFLARMSHEIRTPLNAITGMAYLLKKTNLTLTQKMYADRITQASSNMLNIINDILDFSKIEAGKVEIEVASFSMDQVIQDVVNVVSYKIEEQEISFKLTKDPLVPNWFFGDSKRIEQILLNILNNAAKFTNKGEVSLDIRLIAKENEKYHLSFTIQDTGIGMTQEQVEKLFVPFTQGDSSINRRFGGSGLGLSIVKNLVDMMGGQTQVYSTQGEGSTFIIRLPLSVDKEKESVYIRTLAEHHFKHVKTLVLEKAGADLSLVESYLGAFGMHCEHTGSSAGALHMLETAGANSAEPFELLIVDYETPEVGGLEFVKALRENAKIEKKPKIIMLLPMMREDLFDKLNEYGVDIGVGKPIIPSVLFNGILDIFMLKDVSAAQRPDDKDVTLVRVDKLHKVLVVEDNKTNQLIAKSLLQQIGLESILAANGKEAVELFGQHKDKIAVILMDLHMPVMNGYEAAAEIRKISADIPIIAMTADVILGVKEKCAQSGMHHYISKPFDPDQFLRTIRDIIVGVEEKKSKESEVLDKAAGLQNIGGDMEIYRQVISEYYNENQDTLEKLSLAVDEKRYTDAAQLVHKVKSSSGSIGAALLYDLCKKLQKALEEKRKEEVASLRQAFSSALGKLLEEINRLLTDQSNET